MWNIRTDLPAEQKIAGRFIPWLVMIIVVHGALGLSGSVYLSAVMEGWENNVAGTLTIQVPQSIGEANKDSSFNTKLSRITVILDSDLSVASFQIIENDKIVSLLEPWLGSADIINDLPLPALVDVTLSTSEPETIQALVKLLKQVGPDILVDDHRIWLEKLVDLAKGLEILASAITALLILSLTLTVILATRSSLAECRQAIETLHFVGAKDDYVARQFALRSLIQSLKGGISGLAIALLIIVFLMAVARRIPDGLLPDISLGISYWLLLSTLPVVAGGLAMLAAQITVRRTLAEMI